MSSQSSRKELNTVSSIISKINIIYEDLQRINIEQEIRAVVPVTLDNSRNRLMIRQAEEQAKLKRTVTIDINRKKKQEPKLNLKDLQRQTIHIYKQPNFELKTRPPESAEEPKYV